MKGLPELGELTRGLQAAFDRFSVARVFCDVGTRQLGLHQVAVNYLGADERPVLVIDNAPGVTDDARVHYLAETWMQNPFHRALLERHMPIGDELFTAADVMALSRSVGYSGDFVYTLALPIVDPAGMLGAIYCGHLTPYSDDLRRTLTAAASFVAVRLAQLKVTAACEPTEIPKLTARQLEVAERVARGHTNAELASELGISENTVKKHLKDIFERVGVANRTELAVSIAKHSHSDGFPPGVSRHEGLVVTKSAR